MTTAVLPSGLIVDVVRRRGRRAEATGAGGCRRRRVSDGSGVPRVPGFRVGFAGRAARAPGRVSRRSACGSVNRSRNRSSRNFGVRSVRSTRASWPASVRWPRVEEQIRAVAAPRDRVREDVREKADRARRAAAGAGTSSTFVNAFAPIAKSAIHLPSGDQTGSRRVERVGERAGREHAILLRSRGRARAAPCGRAGTRSACRRAKTPATRSVARAGRQRASPALRREVVQIELLAAPARATTYDEPPAVGRPRRAAIRGPASPSRASRRRRPSPTPRTRRRARRTRPSCRRATARDPEN